ncbi:Hpt domain-containing protein [Glycocaulis profundi]|nr:Hpt domain-containing protein [Glycocaulis profundi]
MDEAARAAMLAGFARQFRERCAEDAELLRRWLAGEADDTALKDRLHRLAGRGGTFGFPDISDRAFALEDVIRAGGVPEREAVAALIARLDAVAAGED